MKIKNSYDDDYDEDDGTYYDGRCKKSKFKC